MDLNNSLLNTPLGNVGMLLAVGISCVALFRGAVAIATVGLERQSRPARWHHP